MFGPRPIKVELWMSKDEIEQEKKQKEAREINQFLSLFVS